jgi:membrane dipeptidase
MMKLIDLHCDTILSCINSNGEVKLEKNNLCIDIKKLKKADSLAQFFAMYVDLKKYSAPMDRCLDMIDCFYNEIEENSADIAFAGSTKELKKNKSEGKISAFLTVEEGGVLEGKLRNLRILYKLGVRLITLTWNYPNCIGYPNFRWEHKDKGLTAFGEEVVAEMNRLGMIIDVSHLSDQGFYDVAELSGKPFIASHSNARAVTNHWRNLTDDMLRKLAEKGGVAGLNLEPEFLGEVGSVEAMTRHVIHMINAAGIEAVAIGTDFDGCSLLTAIKDAGDMHKLWDALSKAGLSGRDMDKIMHKNVERVIRDVMG